MAIFPDKPNPNSTVNNYSQYVDTAVDNAFGGFGKVTVKDLFGGIDAALGNAHRGVSLSEIVSQVDGPILKDMALEVVTVMSNWFEDPKLLCCLIQGIWASYASSFSNTKLAQLQREGISIADSDFGKWLDVLIAFVDLIITFISSDLKKLSAPLIPDIIKEIANGVAGGILLVMQEVLFALRDSAINYILQNIDRAQGLSPDMENIWAKCIPFAQLLNIIKKYVHDYGLFAELFEKIKGYVGGLNCEWAKIKALDFPKNIKDIEFLYWFRDLLIKLKQAAINFDLCVNYGTAPTGGVIETSPPESSFAKQGVGGTEQDNFRGLSKAGSVQGIKVADNGTILKDSAANSAMPILANSSIRTFMNKYYGYPLDYVDNILVGSSSLDAIKGTNINSSNVSNLNADCPNTPSPEALVSWAIEMRNRNL